MRMLVSAARLAAPVALTALCTLPAAAQGFEGTITWQMMNDRTMSQTYKGSQVRTEMSGGRGGPGVMIMDNAAKTMTMIMTERQMYMTMNMNDMNARMEGMEHDKKTPKLTATGKTETIAGKSCEVYRYAEEAGKPETMEMCVAKGMGYFMGGSGGPMGMGRRGGNGPIAAEIAANPDYAKLYKDGFFPLRISRIDGGQVKNEMIATKIEQKPVDASAFQVPAGFTEMKMPAGMPGMGGPPQKP